MKQIFLFFILGSVTGLAQERGLQRFTLELDNDSFVFGLGDKYYTSGIFMHYEFNAKKFPLLKSDKGVLVTATFGQKMFTPKDQDLDIVENYDRPFAGWLFTSLTAFKQNENQIFGIGLEMGVTGNASQAKALHRRFHKTFNFPEIPAWKAQIPSELMFNTSAIYKRKFTNKIFSESVAMIGTKDIYFQQGMYLLFFDDFKTFHQLSINKLQVSVYAALKYRFIGYDALIEGSIWNNKTPLTKDITNHMFLTEAGIKFAYHKIRFDVGYHYNTKQTPQVQGHIYGNLNLGYTF